MVRFSVFNELSLPFSTNENIVEKFFDFFELLEETKKKGLDTLRLSRNFKNYEILQGVNFQQFVGQQQDQDFKRKILSFLTNKGVILIDSPIIKEEETQEQDIINGSEYFFNTQTTDGGLACTDVWNTLAISFNSSAHWNTDNIVLNKQNILSDETIEQKNIDIRHSSKIEHLDSHHDFFGYLELEISLDITQEKFWNQKEVFFPNIIVFCPEVELQTRKLDKLVFQQAMSILRDVETQRKFITDFKHSRESQTVRDNQKLKNMRIFTLDNCKVFFENHVKSLPHHYRIYFIERNNKVHIGYIGKHLET